MKLLTAELVLGQVSDNESFDYYSKIEKSKLIEWIFLIIFDQWSFNKVLKKLHTV